MQDSTLLCGTTLQGGKYEILQVLGRGGFGITYMAEHKFLKKIVAIKEFFMKDICDRQDSGFVTTATSQERREFIFRSKEKFKKEATVISSLNHNNIVKVIDTFEEYNTVYYVMEYVEGQSLTDFVRNNSPLTEDKALNIIKQVCSALSYMHARNILHLDIKPSNLMLDRYGHVTVIDFGISKHYDEEGGATTTSPIGRSKGYAPREQYSNDLMKTLAPNTDIYAVGATLLFLLTGKAPEESIVREDDNDLVIPSHISTNVASAIRKSMSLSRKNRYQSIEEFEQSLVVTVTDSYINDQTEIKVESYPKSSEASPRKEQNNKPTKKGDKIIIKVILFFLGIAITALIIHFCSNTPESLVKRASNAYELGDLPETVRLCTKAIKQADIDKFRDLANQGYVYAQNLLGFCYYYGVEVNQDCAHAFVWFKKAANSGNVHAQRMLGDFYKYGRGVDRDLYIAQQ